MGARSSKVFDRAVSNLNTEFEKCVLLIFLEISVTKVLYNIVILSIFNIYDGSSWSW